MAELLQIILINVVVSCDNVGVIALATRDLPKDKAKGARKLGIGLSLLLKLLFILITGYLFQVPWLHIRIIGGVMLIYVTWNMLRKGDGGHARSTGGGDSFLFAIVSIIAADVSMSLDNVIAILSIVSADGQAPDGKDMLLVLVGLVVCVPLLLWFSEAVTRLMERFAAVTYLCASYLVYTAVRMIFEDETIALFFTSINFAATTQVAAVAGILVLLSGLYTGHAPTPRSAKRRKSIAAIYFFVAVYAFFMVGGIAFLSTVPVVDGFRLTVEMVYHFTPYGANAIYTIGHSPFLFTLAAGILVGLIMEQPDRSYGTKLGWSMVGMVTLIMMELAISTVGITAIFGFGSIHPLIWISNLLLQLMLHCTYVSVFCMIWTFVRSKTATVVLSMLFVLVETMAVEVCVYHNRWLFFAGFLPDYYITSLPDQMMSLVLEFRVALVALVCVGITTYIGSARLRREAEVRRRALA